MTPEEKREARRKWNREHREKRRASQRKSAAKRYHRRKQEAIAFLGGVCVVCGTTEDLEFDHIDPAEVAFRVPMNMSRRWETLLPELKKCQLLCHEHHADKTHNRGPIGYLLNLPKRLEA